MLTCGTYDSGGRLRLPGGLPAKSGVGGGIVALIPNECGICVWSPALEESGNSHAGSLALRCSPADGPLGVRAQACGSRPGVLHRWWPACLPSLCALVRPPVRHPSACRQSNSLGLRGLAPDGPPPPVTRAQAWRCLGRPWTGPGNRRQPGRDGACPEPRCRPAGCAWPPAGLGRLLRAVCLLALAASLTPPTPSGSRGVRPVGWRIGGGHRGRRHFEAWPVLGGNGQVHALAITRQCASPSGVTKVRPRPEAPRAPCASHPVAEVHGRAGQVEVDHHGQAGNVDAARPGRWPASLAARAPECPSARARAPWLSWPCRASAFRPQPWSLRARCSLRYCDDTNTSARVQPSLSMRPRSSWLRALRPPAARDGGCRARCRAGWARPPARVRSSTCWANSARACG